MSAIKPLPIHVNDSIYWKVLQQKDPTSRDAFFYGATTTMIFCRPTCPARLVRRANTVFFDTLAEAQDAGYRPCKRCQPYDADWHRDAASEAILEKARQLISTAMTDGRKWTVSEIVAGCDISIGYLHRLFKKKYNMSPKAFAHQHLGHLESSENLGLISSADVTAEAIMAWNFDDWLTDYALYPTEDCAQVQDTFQPERLLDDWDPTVLQTTHHFPET